jgi:plastocyanin
MVSPDRFSPATRTIKVGDRVRATNSDSTDHTFTDAGVFDSGDVGPNASYTYRFTKAGRFDFVCRYHASVGMMGTITVR